MSQAAKRGKSDSGAVRHIKGDKDAIPQGSYKLDKEKNDVYKGLFEILRSARAEDWTGEMCGEFRFPDVATQETFHGMWQAFFDGPVKIIRDPPALGLVINMATGMGKEKQEKKKSWGQIFEKLVKRDPEILGELKHIEETLHRTEVVDLRPVAGSAADSVSSVSRVAGDKRKARTDPLIEAVEEACSGALVPVSILQTTNGLRILRDAANELDGCAAGLRGALTIYESRDNALQARDDALVLVQETEERAHNTELRLTAESLRACNVQAAALYKQGHKEHSDIVVQMKQKESENLALVQQANAEEVGRAVAQMQNMARMYADLERGMGIQQVAFNEREHAWMEKCQRSEEATQMALVASGRTEKEAVDLKNQAEAALRVQTAAVNKAAAEARAKGAEAEEAHSQLANAAQVSGEMKARHDNLVRLFKQTEEEKQVATDKASRAAADLEDAKAGHAEHKAKAAKDSKEYEELLVAAHKKLNQNALDKKSSDTLHKSLIKQTTEYAVEMEQKKKEKEIELVELERQKNEIKEIAAKDRTREQKTQWSDLTSQMAKHQNDITRIEAESAQASRDHSVQLAESSAKQAKQHEAHIKDLEHKHGLELKARDQRHEQTVQDLQLDAYSKGSAMPKASGASASGSGPAPFTFSANIPDKGKKPASKAANAQNKPWPITQTFTPAQMEQRERKEERRTRRGNQRALNQQKVIRGYEKQLRAQSRTEGHLSDDEAMEEPLPQDDPIDLNSTDDEAEKPSRLSLTRATRPYAPTIPHFNRHAPNNKPQHIGQAMARWNKPFTKLSWAMPHFRN